MQTNLEGHEILRCVTTVGLQEEPRLKGFFRALVWSSERAYERAQQLLALTRKLGEPVDDSFWDRYFGYCDMVIETPNIGITAGLHLALQAIGDIGTPLKFGGPASVTNKAFLGISNGVTAVTAADTDMSGASKFYKGIDATFPTETLFGGKATLTWQVTYGTTEAQFVWNEALIGATSGTVPNAGSGAAGVAAIPASSTLLAHALWSPSPLTKGASIVSQQYLLSVS